MGQQTHYPHSAGLALTALAAATPIFVLLVLLGVARRPAWLAFADWVGSGADSGDGLVRDAECVGVERGDVGGAAFGMFPMGWIVFWAILPSRDGCQREILRNPKTM